jgi:hypothetical protein
MKFLFQLLARRRIATRTKRECRLVSFAMRVAKLKVSRHMLRIADEPDE